MEVSGNETICVVGLGYVGLPTAISFHSAGFRVIGVDISEHIVGSLNNGVSHLIDSSSKIEIPVDSERWTVSTKFEDAIPISDVILITVPTPVNSDNSPDLSYVESASKSVLENISRERKTAVVLESTVYPGVTRRVLGGLCESLDIRENEEVVLAYCPERVNPGDFERGIESVAQIVGCDNPIWGSWLSELFGRITRKSATFVGGLEVAEASKLIENVQRDIDIAFANELSMILPRIGIDVEDVLAAASTKWNFHRHTPGIGVGGHCIPVDPYYYIELSEKVGFPSSLATASRKINNSMPENAASEILGILENEGESRVLILGYSYKANVGDTRETPVEPLAINLKEGGCDVMIHDPLVGQEELPDWVENVVDPSECRKIDLIVLATSHENYDFSNVDFWSSMKNIMTRARIYDGRRTLPREEMESDGWQYYGIGNPRS
jgi:nucleotide sugar dehydrogenase